MIGDGYLDVTDYYSRHPHLIGVTWPVYFLVGPSLYLHYRELSSPTRPVFTWRQFLYFLPAIVIALAFIYGSSLRENESVPRSLRLITSLGGKFPTMSVAPYLASLYNVVFLTSAYVLVRDYKSRIKHSFSAIETSNLAWLSSMLFSAGGVTVLYFVLIYVATLLGINRECNYGFYLVWAGSTFFMAYRAITHPEIFSRMEGARQTELRTAGDVMIPTVSASALEVFQEDRGTASGEKYKRTRVSDERVAVISHQLLHLMETEKPYLEPELTLPQLADKLGVVPHQLSQVINREMNKSFFDFVNEYRIQEAKRLLSSPQCDHLSILGIALDAGFNSKSAFYIAFGKYAGITPSEYRKQLRQSGHGEA